MRGRLRATLSHSGSIVLNATGSAGALDANIGAMPEGKMETAFPGIVLI
jgi:hypothetical protein